MLNIALPKHCCPVIAGFGHKCMIPITDELIGLASVYVADVSHHIARTCAYCHRQKSFD